MDLKLSASDFQEARATISGLVHRTPLLSTRSLDARTGLRIWLKAENLQKTGSFKPRGAFNMVRHLTPAERARGLITASAGNHGQAVAFVAAHEGVPGVVVMPEGANRTKLAAVRGYGAEAILHGRLWDESYARSLELAEERGLVYVHPFKQRHIMAGQATVALEILEDLPDVEAALIPIGGGGLIAGMAEAFRSARPGIRIIGVEPAGSPNMRDSRASGSAIELEDVTTIADGLATKRTDSDVFRMIDRLVDDLVTVSDQEIVDAILFLLERAKLLAEPAGAASTAALLADKTGLPSATKTVVVVSGGNFDVAGRMHLGYEFR